MADLDVAGVLFDNDGVLVDSIPGAFLAWRQWGAEYLPGFVPETDLPHGIRAFDLVSGMVAPDLVDEAVLRIERLELDVAATTTPIPGATAFTRALPADRWVVVTSASTRLARARLEAAGHAPHAIVSADDVPRGKPHPDPYLLGAVALGLEPSRCVVFEDADAGVTAARAAGVAYVVGVGDHVDPATVDHLVPDLTAVSVAGVSESGIVVRVA